MSAQELQQLIAKSFEPEQPIDFAVKAYQIYHTQLQLTRAVLREHAERIEHIVRDRLLDAEPLIPIASGRSRILASEFLKKGAINLGLDVEDPREALNIERYRNPVPVVVSTGGGTREVNSLAKLFYERGIRPVVITGNPLAELGTWAGDDNLIPLRVATDTREKDYLLSQLFGATQQTFEDEVRKYCPLGSLGQFASNLTAIYLIGMLASLLYKLGDAPRTYANLLLDGVERTLLEFYPHFVRRKAMFDTICRVIAASDFFGTVGEEYSSHIVQAFSMRLKQLEPQEKRDTREVHVFSSHESNPLYSPKFLEKYQRAVIFANSGRGRGFASEILQAIRTVRSQLRPGQGSIETIGMTFTPNSYVHRETDYSLLLTNTYYPVSADGSTVVRTYEPLSLAVTDSFIPTIAIYNGTSPEKIEALMKRNHNILGTL